MTGSEFDERVAAVRRFNRFYTRQIGLLQEGYLKSPFSLSEVRVLYELAHREKPTAAELSRDLGLDAGYLSRVLRGFEKRRLISRTRSPADGRQSHLGLTARGQAAFAPLERRSHQEIGEIVAALPAPEQKVPYILRPHQPGDMGWVVHRHGALYGQEYGWDERFEATVAEIVAKFIHNYDPKKERCWIAEKDGEIIGSVFLVKQSKTVAKLRLLLVEPKGRGLGIGTRLVEECIRFARQAGYRKMTLWTNSILRAARHIYEEAGFRMAHQERHQSFGHALIGETWELDL